MNNLLYTVEKECPLCHSMFSVTKVRNRLRMVKQDSDFCTTYQELNPYYYTVWVCTHCGYAAQDTFFVELPPSAQQVRSFLKGKKVNVNFSGPRTREQAIDTMKLAIYFGGLGQIPASRIGGLYIKLAWIYREAQDKENEHKALKLAQYYYDEALEKESFPIGNMSQYTLEYLTADLMHRTGSIEEATRRLSRIVNNPQVRLEKRTFEMAKELWYLIREQNNEEGT